MSGFLDSACAAATARVAAASASVPLDELRRRSAGLPEPPPFAAALGGRDVAVIAEVKRASPSRGDIAAIPDPRLLAADYAAGGAAAVSVLTEPSWFKGSLDDLTDVAASVDVPVLRKDFVVDAYQAWEARAAGAAAVLLIVAALDAAQLTQLLRATDEAGLDALVEVHDPGEVDVAVSAHERAATARPLVLGVNSRDLTTLTVDRDQFAGVRDGLPPGGLAVAESGVSGPDDVRRLAALGADAVLVGEHVATAADPQSAVAALVAAGRAVPAAAEEPR